MRLDCFEELSLEIPEFEGAIVMTRGKEFAIRTETHTPNFTRIASDRSQYSTVDLPEFEGAIVTSSGDRLTIGTKAHITDLIAVTMEGFQELPLEIPKFEGFVRTGSRDRLAVRTEAKAPNAIPLTALGANRCQRLTLPAPQSNRLIVSGSGNDFATGTNAHTRIESRYARLRSDGFDCSDSTT